MLDSTQEEGSDNEETVLPELELNRFRDRWKAELLQKQPVATQLQVYVIFLHCQYVCSSPCT